LFVPNFLASISPKPYGNDMKDATAILNAGLENALARGLPGVVAIAADRDGIFYEGARGVRRIGDPAPMTLDCVLTLFSCTKPITATAALQLWEVGDLDLDAPVRQYAPEIGALQVLAGFGPDGEPRLRPPKREITTRMLLNHTAGMSYEFLNADCARLRSRLDAAASRGRKAELMMPLLFEPGEAWEYSRSIDWVGIVVEAVAGQRLDVVFRKKILGPLNMNDTGFELNAAMAERRAAMHAFDPTGQLAPIEFGSADKPAALMGGSALLGTGRDYMRFLSTWLNEGQGEGGRVLRPETVAYASRNHLGELPIRPLPSVDAARTRGIEFFPGLKKSWALSFLRLEEDAPTGRSAGSLSWAGLGNLYFWIDPKNGVAGFWAAQYLPFLHEAAVSAFEAVETEIYRMRRV
jgi:methyl acetate hydrolase